MSNALVLLHDDVYGSKDTFVAVCSDRSLNFEKEAGFAIQSITTNDYACQIAMKNRHDQDWPVAFAQCSSLKSHHCDFWPH